MEHNPPEPPEGDGVERAGPQDPGEPTTASPIEPTTGTAPGFLPAEPLRLASESVLVRVIATLGVIGIGTAVGAILVANNVAGWITGLVVSALSVILAAVLWRSRRL